MTPTRIKLRDRNGNLMGHFYLRQSGPHTLLTYWTTIRDCPGFRLSFMRRKAQDAARRMDRIPVELAAVREALERNGWPVARGWRL